MKRLRKFITGGAVALALALLTAAATPETASAQTVCYQCMPVGQGAVCVWTSPTTGQEQCMSGEVFGVQTCQLWGFSCPVFPGGGGPGPRTFLAPDGSVQLAGPNFPMTPSPGPPFLNGVLPPANSIVIDASGSTTRTCRGVIVQREQSSEQVDAVRRETATIVL